MLTSWQTHGAKLEAVRAEFQTDPQHIRDVLRVWQLQGDKINAFLESEGVQENGGTGRLPAAHGSHTANGGFTVPAVHLSSVLHLECCQKCINILLVTWLPCEHNVASLEAVLRALARA